ncbi:hypothetical protein RB653_005353 [Dictyostelium firmibasis]|uniref:Carbohydrate binding domain-containing protein n=1 Tax=Dictyostelium firmibasis TaxID=79012 RepID=A0AAN7U138_9MYCE
MFKKLLFLALSFVFFTVAICDNSLTISQIQTGSWEGHSAWEVTLVNTGTRAIIDATLVAESNLELDKPENLWSMEILSPNKYHFPAWITQNGGLMNGTKHTFGYINSKTTPAIFSLLFLALTFTIFAIAFGDNALTFSCNKIKEWDNGSYTQWEVTMTNTDSSKRTIIDATIVGDSNLKLDKTDGLWSLELTTDNKYHFPTYLSQFGGLKFGSNHTFGYINHINTSATFTATDIKY